MLSGAGGSLRALDRAGNMSAVRAFAIPSAPTAAAPAGYSLLKVPEDGT
jgi:hypothetical protein